MTLSPQWLDELRQRTTLSSLIGGSLKLTRKGKEFAGCCPFHNEKSPSFYVNDDKGFYHCFGCSAHGDAIKWMTDHRGLTFMDAVKELADAAGLDMPPQSSERPEARSERDLDHAIMKRAADWFTAQLASPAGEAARRYLDSRQIPADVQSSFGFGYAPKVARGTPSPLLTALQDVDPSRLVDLGLIKRSDEDGHLFDFFRDRLMIPIRDQRGRVVAFGGRILGKGEPKYLNSPDTRLFDKGRTIYNLDRASPAARRARRFVFVEGYLDVVAMARAGVEEVGSTSGTALTEAQMVLAWRLCDVPVCCFDGDQAGRKAAFRAATRALPGLQPGRSLAFIFPPEGKDPDDILREKGPSAVRLMLEAPHSLCDVIFEHEKASTPLSTPEQRAGLRERLRLHCREITNQDLANEYHLAFSEKLSALQPRAAERTFRGKSKGPWNAPPPPSEAATALSQQGIGDAVQISVVAALLRNPELIRGNVEEVAMARFSNPDLARLRAALVDFAGHEASIAGHGGALDDHLERQALLGLAQQVRLTRCLPFSFLHSDHPRARTDFLSTLSRLS